MKIVIRAGGIGARLWPLSRSHHPKQFQAVVGEATMVRDTYDRVKTLVEAGNIFVSINRHFLEKLRAVLPELPESNIIVETATRNTGPAMCLEAVWLSRRCGADEIIASLPADDYISDPAVFGDLLRLSREFIAEHPDHIVTPAVKPEVIDSGYSYFKIGDSLVVHAAAAIYQVAEVAEKPDYETCRLLIESGAYYCHTGMYVWRLGLIESLFVALQPEWHKICHQVVDATIGGDFEAAATLYNSLTAITIESAITQKAPRLAMSVSDNLVWSDLGKWPVIKRMLSTEGDNLLKGAVLTNDVKNCLIYNQHDKKVIVANDLSDLVVVDTPDALFISSLKNSAEVKKCLERMKEEGKEEYL